ncbi:MAG: hypothetical protein ACK42D_01255 [Candidatus Paceibacteria bacterium]
MGHYTRKSKTSTSRCYNFALFSICSFLTEAVHSLAILFRIHSQNIAMSLAKIQVFASRPKQIAGTGAQSNKKACSGKFPNKRMWSRDSAREPLLSLPFREVDLPRSLHLDDEHAGSIAGYACRRVGFWMRFTLPCIMSIADTLCD